jgi:hypothetical protein
MTMALGRIATTPGYCFRCRSHDRECEIVEVRDRGWLLCRRCYAMKALGLMMEIQAQAWGIGHCPECDYRVCRCKEMS